MHRIALLFFCALSLWPAEIRTLTLRDAIDIALKQNPDVVLARLDEQKAEEAVRLARDPFIPKVVVGSGLAYSSGLPMSIEGATPSIFQARAVGDVFNRQQSYRVASAREARRGAAVDGAAKREEVTFRTIDLFLDAEKAGKIAEIAQAQVKGLEGVLESVRARVSEGRELPIESRKAELNLARARYRSQITASDMRAAETALAAALGLDANEQVRPAAVERPIPALPPSPDAAVEAALRNSKEIRSLESKLVAKGFDARAERAARLPRVDLVAQYAMLARYNNYDEFFRKFQRNNGQLGVSFQVPLWNGPGVEAAARTAEAEAAQFRVQIRNARRRIDNDTRKVWDDLDQSRAGLEVARLDLEVARDQVSVLLAQMQEGRAALRQVEDARMAETDKWIAFYDANSNLDKARVALLRQTGDLAAAIP